MFKRVPKFLAIAAFSCLVTACGGGGGGGGGASTPAPAPTPTPAPPPEPPPPPPPAPQLFRIAGTITASSSQAVDGDTNDRAGAVRANDTVATAQPIANPITLGGYVNQPGRGAPGRSTITGDTDDYFRVDLLAGQSITMLVADYRQADADLYLYDTQGRILDFSIESGEIETLVIAEDGTYVVNAFAARGATNYILAIGNQSTVSGQSGQHYRILPWQTVVKYHSTAESTSAKTGKIRDRLQIMGMEQRAGGPGRTRLIEMLRGRPGGTASAERAGSALDKLHRIDDPQLQARLETLLAIKALAREPEIEYAEPNYEVRASATPDDPAYPLQWHYPLIDLPLAWDTTTGDPAVVVAVVDTGILSAHPDMVGQLVAGYDFVRSPNSAGDGNSIDPNPEDPGDRQGGSSGGFHGTHVSGTVAAAGNNGAGVAGVAYSARVMPVRALGVGGSGTTYDVDQAIRFTAGLDNDSGTLPSRPADIINLSLGGAPFSQSSQDLYRQVRAAGVIMVAAAGNEASSLPAYPAAYEGVISVAAVDAQRRRAGYSNTGASIDIAAPGGDNGVDLNGDGYPDGVLSTDGLGASGDFGYSYLNGTSMAAPHVAGVIALMKSVNPQLTPADIDELLIRGDLTDDLGDPGRDNEYGYGLVNAQKAVLAALEAGGGDPVDRPILSASAATLNFSSSVNTLELELENGGTGELALTGITATEPWLQLDPFDVDGNSLGLYQATVDRTGLDDGVYSAEITANSSVNTLNIEVLMSVGESAAADVGVVYILLYEPEAIEPIDEVRARSQEGRYEFEFNNVSPGLYEVFAGSDADNDLLICDPGEACGSWLTVDQPITIDLESDREDINFPVDYVVAIPAITSEEKTASPGKSRAERKPRRKQSR